jgi:hypothetical protein
VTSTGRAIAALRALPADRDVTGTIPLHSADRGRRTDRVAVTDAIADAGGVDARLREKARS